MSRLSPKGADPNYPSILFRPPKLRRCKDGSLECILHPLARLKKYRYFYYCTECYEVVIYKYPRCSFSELKPIKQPEKREILMSRTRPARIQEE